MIYLEKPADFNPKFEVVSCFIECNDRILLLHRQDTKPEGNTWCLPAGKMDAGENSKTALVREVREETSIEIDVTHLMYLKTVYVIYPTYQFVYHMFRVVLPTFPQVTLSPDEHKDYRWVTLYESLSMNLIPDEDACIKLCYSLE